MSGLAAELYTKYAPRWLKVIRWREHGARLYKNQILYIKYIILPTYVAYSLPFNVVAQNIVLKRPKTEEELNEIRQNNRLNVYHRDWEIDQYVNDVAPHYDLSKRRKKYPEYYGDRYDGFYKNV